MEDIKFTPINPVIIFDGLCTECDDYTLFYAEIGPKTIISERCPVCDTQLIVTNIMGIHVGREYYGMLSRQ